MRFRYSYLTGGKSNKVGRVLKPSLNFLSGLTLSSLLTKKPATHLGSWLPYQKAINVAFGNEDIYFPP